jgi:alpha-L-rhamnosidase
MDRLIVKAEDDGGEAAAFSNAVAISAPATTGRLPVLATTFVVDGGHGGLVTARLAATAHGIYDARLDGQRVTDSVLNPGWDSYERRLQFQMFDVLSLLRGTEDDAPKLRRHRLEVTLAGGWWHGNLGFSGMNANYGDELALVAELTLIYSDGYVEVHGSGPDWTATLSKITSASLYNGQSEDRRLTPGDPMAVHVAQFDREALVAESGVPISRHEVFRPIKIWRSPSGKTLVDFGQDLVGWIKLIIPASTPAGTTITLRHAEVLERGELGTRPLRAARATDKITVGGGEQTVFEPVFTYHGFRYAQVDGWPGEIGASNLEAVAVYANMPQTGSFECSQQLVNQLIHNSLWSQKGNFLAVPTDCPQRDERLGWTGDIAAYAPTACFQFDVSGFLNNWLMDLQAETVNGASGYVPYVVPDVFRRATADHSEVLQTGPVAVWGDAAVWVPQALWNAYGDKSQLARQYPGMVAHLRSVERVLSQTGLWDTGFQFGDWLDPDAPPDDPAAAKADAGVVATACLYRSAVFTAKAAEIIGNAHEAEHWRSLAARVRAAFLEHYVDVDGTVRSDCATVYALAIHFGLLDGAVKGRPADEVRSAAGDRLSRIVKNHGYRVSTGFAGTSYVTWALSETGHIDDAYRLLLEEDCPSWLYPPRMGATTIWERWDSLLPNGEINPGEMTSFNHYALGSIADWIYQVVLGIRAASPGYQQVLIRPTPGPGIHWAKGSYDSPHGRITVAWDAGDDQPFHLDVTIPDDISAIIILPDGGQHRVVGGQHLY